MSQMRILTDTLVDHVDLKRVELIIDVVFGWCVHVKLHKTKVCACKRGCSVDNDFDRRPQVLELHCLLGDVHNRAVCSGPNGGI